jgi:hypothetical protein
LTVTNKLLDRYSFRSQRHAASLLFSASFGWRPAGKSPVSDHRTFIMSDVKTRRASHFLVPFVTHWRQGRARRLLLLSHLLLLRLAAVDNNTAILYYSGTIHFGLGSVPTKMIVVPIITSISIWTWTTMIPYRLMIANCWILARHPIRIE